MANRRIGLVSSSSPNRTQAPQYPTLVKEGSPLYNLTFDDEVQSQLGNTGKPLHHMNLDELYVVSAEPESGQVVQNPNPDSSSSFLLGNSIGNNSSNKTIPEVWKEIEDVNNRSMDNNNNHHHHLQHSILGQTTLEEFIARTGININLGSNQDNNVGIEPMVVMPSSSQHEEWLQMQMQMQMQMQIQMPAGIHHVQQHQICPDFSTVSKSVYDNSVMESGYSENSMAISMQLESTCSNSKGGGGCVGRKQRHSDEMIEKSIERKQKRMAKNRESAARSRAKKQGSRSSLSAQSIFSQEHINKLETARIQLTEIKRLHEKLKVLDPQLFSTRVLDKNNRQYQLRRTSSNTF